MVVNVNITHLVQHLKRHRQGTGEFVVGEIGGQKLRKHSNASNLGVDLHWGPLHFPTLFVMFG